MHVKFALLIFFILYEIIQKSFHICQWSSNFLCFAFTKLPFLLIYNRSFNILVHASYGCWHPCFIFNWSKNKIWWYIDWPLYFAFFLLLYKCIDWAICLIWKIKHIAIKSIKKTEINGLVFVNFVFCLSATPTLHLFQRLKNEGMSHVSEANF